MTETPLKPQRILVVKAAGIGDLILAVPALRALRTRFPRALIDLLVTPKCGNLLKHCPYVDDTYVIRTRGMENRVHVSEFGRICQTLYRLRKKEYDVLVNLHRLFSNKGSFRMKWLCRAVGARHTVGRNTDGRGTFYDAWIDDSWEHPAFDQRHEVELNLDLVRLLGAEDPGRGLKFWIRNADRSRLKALLKREGWCDSGGPRIVLNVGGDALYKRWPDEHCAVLGDLLVEEMSAQVFIIGGEKERPVAHRVIGRMKHRPVDLAGKVDIPELAALLEASDLMVTNDTGPMHLAAAVGTPVVALFGPGKPDRYAPYGPEGFHIVLRHETECSPCTNFACATRGCMRKIQPEEVLDAVRGRLAVKEEACP